MKNIVLVAVLAFPLLLQAQAPGEKRADTYEMRTYYLLHLLRGPNRDQDSATAASLQRGHLAHLDQMHSEGKLALAGPIVQNGSELLGIGVMVAPSADSARAWAERDPAVRAGRLRVQILPWMSARGMCLP